MPNFGTNTTTSHALATTDGPLSEVNTPESIAKLAPSLEKFQPQVQILSPQPDQILTDDRAIVKLQVSDLPIFKSPELGLGNHLHVILDKQTYKGVYDLTQPLVFENLAAGSHTLRVFASRPWHESFKNEGAYAQTTFHVLTKTAENNPNPQQPLLTYSRPTGTYGAEPIMLDYYLTNAPSHLVAAGSSDSLPDWRIRATVNNQQFIIDRWTPIYLQGFKQGKNWVKLELVDDRGNPIPNVYNDAVGMITYDPHTKDPLAKLVRGELTPDLARTLVDPQYIAVKPTPLPVPVPAPVPVSTPVATPATLAPQPIVNPSPKPIVVPAPQPLAEPLPERIAVPSPSPAIVATPQAILSPIAITPPQPSAIPSPTVAQTPSPIASPEPVITSNLIPVAQPAPVVNSAPVEVRIPVSPSPVAIPEPSISPFVPATSIPRTPITTPTPELTRQPAPLPIQNPAPIAVTATNTPQQTAPEQPTWKDKAIELIQIAGVKTRAFTHTIPGKAQRFGHNVQIWASKAMETIDSWRNR